MAIDQKTFRRNNSEIAFLDSDKMLRYIYAGEVLSCSREASSSEASLGRFESRAKSFNPDWLNNTGHSDKELQS